MQTTTCVSEYLKPTKHKTKKHARSERERKRRRAAAVKRYAQSPRGKFSQHKKNAKVRGIPFELTFVEWLRVWVESGHFDERSNKTADGYVMARRGDRGPYAVGNVEIVAHRINVAERNRNFAYAKRAGIAWDWYTDGPMREPEREPEPDVPF